MEVYRIQKKWLNHVMKYAMKSRIDLTGVYSLKVWNDNGYDKRILEVVK